jgi:hypothetical protein
MSHLAPQQQLHGGSNGICAAVLCLQVGGLLFGYDIGASSGVLASLTSPQLSGTDW